MRDTAKTHDLRRRNTRRTRMLVDAAMALVYLLQMAPYQTGGWYHELAGIAFVLLLAVHHALNARWLRVELRRRDWLPILLDAALLVCVAGVAVSGMLMAQHVRLLRWGGAAHLVRPLHACLTYTGLMLVSVHAGLHLPRRGVDKLAPLTRMAMGAMLVVLGAYAFNSLNVLAKLTMGMGFPDGMTPLPLLVGKHALLAGPFVLLGMVLTRREKRRERE